MAQYNIGDMVLIKRHNIEQSCGVDCACFPGEMSKYIGLYARIKDIVSTSRGTYHIDLDEGHWCWSECMLDMVCSTDRKCILKDKKEGNMSDMLSPLAQKKLDKDTQALVEAGVLYHDLRINNAGFIMDFLVEKYYKELAEEARKLLAERKREERKSR